MNPHKKTNFIIGDESIISSSTATLDVSDSNPSQSSRASEPLEAIDSLNFYQEIQKCPNLIASRPLYNSTLTLASRNSSGDCLLPYTINKHCESYQSNVCGKGDKNAHGFGITIGPNKQDLASDTITGDSLLSTGLQVSVAFTLAGFGNVGAGLILDQVQHWFVFKSIAELVILVPSLLGLKGNLEMTMASRLSTQANLGNMRDFKTTLKMAKGNIALVQCQATLIAFLASLIAITANIARNGSFNVNNSLILCASSLITANFACFLLGTCMVLVIVISHRFEIDPDNIATPIAASLGDVTTLALLAAFAQLIQNHTPVEGVPILCLITCIIFIALLPFWFYYSYKNEYTSNVITTGWTPVIFAMIISSMGGFILDYAMSRYDRLALFQPVINGLGGNLVAVQASRLSTYMHRLAKLGHIPFGAKSIISPFKAFIGSDINVSTARIFLLLSIPIHILFVLIIRGIKGLHEFEVTSIFLIFYSLAAFFQIILLLYLAYNLVMILWRNSIDPDNFSIPILTALGDFLGSAFLLFAFMLLSLLDDPNSKMHY